jgi:hypothetical protein
MPQKLPSLKPFNMLSPNMFPAFFLECTMVEKGTDYSETTVTMYQ